MWSFELSPSGGAMGMFSTNGKGHYKIIEDSSQMPLNYVLTSKHFEGKTEEEVVRIGLFIMTLIKGYSIIADENYDGINPNLHSLYFDNDKVQLTLIDPDFNSIDEILDLTPCNEDEKDVISRAFKPGFFRDVVMYAGLDWNLPSISKINDELINFVKEKGGKDIDFRTNKDFGRFQATANSKAIGGYNARHGSAYGGKKPYSKTPMSLEEASNYIVNYLNAVLMAYFGFEISVIWKKEEINIDEMFE
jgi:hypothetical protein